MTLNFMQAAIAFLANVHLLNDKLQAWIWESPLLSMVLAQAASTDLTKNVQGAFKAFIESGQVWALIIGVVVGYMVRVFTTYG